MRVLRALCAAVFCALCFSIACGPDQTVRFGVIAPQSGSLASFGPSWSNAIEMAALHVNQGGGILGRRLEIVSVDSGGDPASAAQEALAMVQRYRPAAMIVADGSPVARAVVEALLPRGVVIVCSAATAPVIADHDDRGLVWRTAPSDLMQGGFMAAACITRGLLRAGIFYQDDDYGRGIRDGFSKAYTDAGGQVLEQISFSPDQSSHVSDLTRVFAPQPDIVLLPSYINNAKVILQQWHGLGLGGRWMLSEANYDTQLLSIGDAAEGALVVECGMNEQSGFREAYRQLYDAGPLTFAAHAYDSVMLLALAAEKAGHACSAAIAGQLGPVSGPEGTAVGIGADQYRAAAAMVRAGGSINYEGASGPIDFDETGEVTGASYQLWEVSGNAFAEAQ